MQTSYPDLSFKQPNPERDAPMTLRWFQSPHGRETLLLMGNAESELTIPSLKSEQETLQEFIDLKTANKQLTWMIRINEKIIGVAWIELVENHGVKSPSVHLMIGDIEFRGKGIGSATMIALVEYIKNNIKTSAVYSRHLKSNIAVASMNRKIGFVDDGEPYVDENELEWQNVILAV